MTWVETFDGLEGERAPTRAADCPRCGSPRTFELWAFVDRSRPGWKLSDAEVAAHGLHRAVERGLTVTRVGPGLPPAFLGELACEACGASGPVVASVWEFQPCRWMGGVVR